MSNRKVSNSAKPKRKTKYSESDRTKAIQLALKYGNVAEASRELNINKRTLASWVHRYYKENPEKLKISENVESKLADFSLEGLAETKFKIAQKADTIIFAILNDGDVDQFKHLKSLNLVSGTAIDKLILLTTRATQGDDDKYFDMPIKPLELLPTNNDDRG